MLAFAISLLDKAWEWAAILALIALAIWLLDTVITGWAEILDEEERTSSREELAGGGKHDSRPSVTHTHDGGL